MSTQTLTSVAINVVGQYNQAGKQLVRAYRVGAERAVGAVNERFAAVVNARQLPLVNDNVKASLIVAQQQITGVVANGLNAGANGADSTVDQLARGVKGGIERVSETGTKIESVFNTSVFDTVGVFALPVAYVSLEIGNLVAQGAKRLTERVAGADDIAVAVPAKKAVRRGAKKAVARTSRRA